MQPSDLERLIIFPLPNVVLLPCTELPLHIFEPRYRTMTRDAIEQERLIAMATIPAKTPGPMIAISSNAQIRELIDRDETMISKAIGRMIYRLGVVLRAARKATGTARISANSVPSVAMFNVSQMGSHSELI